MTDLAHLRIDLANARIELRDAKDHYETTRAICEMAVVTTGKNAEDRKRELTVALADDPRHTKALSRLRACEVAIDRVQADIDAAEDMRREREWHIRERLAIALSGQAEDAAFDHVQDRRAVDFAKRVGPRKVYVGDEDLPF